MKKFTREDLLKMQKLIEANSISEPTISFSTPTTLTGEQLMKIVGEAGINLSVKVNPNLFDNTAWLLEKDLFVSKGVYDCLADEDTANETMKSLTIIALPKLPKISAFDTRINLPY